MGILEGRVALDADEADEADEAESGEADEAEAREADGTVPAEGALPDAGTDRPASGSAADLGAHLPWREPAALRLLGAAEERERRLLAEGADADCDEAGAPERLHHQLRERLACEKSAEAARPVRYGGAAAVLGPWGWTCTADALSDHLRAAQEAGCGVAQAVAAAADGTAVAVGLSRSQVLVVGAPPEREGTELAGRLQKKLRGSLGGREPEAARPAAGGPAVRVYGQPSQATITALAFLAGGSEFVLTGHSNGALLLWDLAQADPVKAVSGEHHSAVLRLRALPANTAKLAAVAVDAAGGACVHTFAVNLLKRYSAASRRMEFAETAEGEGAFARDVAVLPGVAGAAADVVAFSCTDAVRVARMGPGAEASVFFRFPLATEAAARRQLHPPAVRWRPPGKSGGAELALAVDRDVLLLTVPPPPSESDGHIAGGPDAVRVRIGLEEPAAALGWLDGAALAVVSARGGLRLFDAEGALLEAVPLGASLAFQTALADGYGNPVKTFHNSADSCAADGLLHVLGGGAIVKTVRLLPWSDRLELLKSAGEWEDALAAALRMHRALLTNACLAAAPPSPDAVKSTAVEDLTAFVEAALRGAEGRRLPVLSCAGIAIELCLGLRATDCLFGDVWRVFSRFGQRDALLEMLEAPIVADRVPRLAPEIMQALVEFFTAKGEPERVERCVLHMDIGSLDFNQVTRLCQQHGLYSALLYIFNRGLAEFIAPAQDLLHAVVESAAEAPRAALADKLLVYLQCCFEGRAFPPGRGRLDAKEVPVARCGMLAFLLYGRAMGGADPDVTSIRRHPVLCELVYLRGPAVLAVIRAAFAEWDTVEADLLDAGRLGGIVHGADGPKAADRTALQAVVHSLLYVADELARAGVHATSEAVLACVAAYLAEGRATTGVADLAKVCEHLCRQSRAVGEPGAAAPAGYHEGVALRILREAGISKGGRLALGHRWAPSLEGGTGPESADEAFDLQGLLAAFEAAGFHGALAELHTALGHFPLALAALLRLPADEAGASARVFAYIHAAHRRVAAEQIPARLAEFADSVLAVLPELVRRDPRAAALLAADPNDGGLFPAGFGADASRRLAAEPELNFRFLQHRAWNGGGLDDELVETYVGLLCAFEPAAVLPYLRARSDYRVAACREICGAHGVRDAEAFLLEREGDVEGAIALLLRVVHRRLRTLAACVGRLDEAALAGAEGGGRSPAVHGSGPARRARLAFAAALAVCQRHAAERNKAADGGSQDPNAVWFAVLAACLQPLQALARREREAEAAAATAAAGGRRLLRRQLGALRGELQDLADGALQSMAGQVPLPAILKHLAVEHSDVELGDFRATIRGMLAAYSQELRVLTVAKRIFEADVTHQAARLNATLVRALANVRVVEAAPGLRGPLAPSGAGGEGATAAAQRRAKERRARETFGPAAPGPRRSSSGRRGRWRERVQLCVADGWIAVAGPLCSAGAVAGQATGRWTTVMEI